MEGVGGLRQYSHPFIYIYIYINTKVGLVMKYLGYDFGEQFIRHSLHLRFVS